MPNNTGLKVFDDSNKWINWIEKAIAEKYIKYYKYEDFSNIQEIGAGSFGKVYRANRKKSPKYFALKSFPNFNNATAKEVVREVIILIIQFLVIILYMFYLFIYLILYLFRLNFSLKLIFMIMLFVFMVLQLV
jgi:hypothetical protein